MRGGMIERSYSARRRGAEPDAFEKRERIGRRCESWVQVVVEAKGGSSGRAIDRFRERNGPGSGGDGSVGGEREIVRRHGTDGARVEQMPNDGSRRYTSCRGVGAMEDFVEQVQDGSAAFSCAGGIDDCPEPSKLRHE